MTKSLPPKSLVLYADDDSDDLELIREAFDEFSAIIELLTFKDGIELLGYLKSLKPLQPKPCLIILDINMPVLDGKQTLIRLRAMTDFEEVPVMLFSTSTLPSETVFARSHNAGFVTKPLHTKQIHLLVDRLMEQCTDEIKEKIRKERGK
jgi:CheY-like chemotaxis protein